MRALVWSCLFAPAGLILAVLALKKMTPDSEGYRAARFAFWNSVSGFFTGALLAGTVCLLLEAQVLHL